MKPSDLLRAAVLPLTNLSVLFSLIAFWLLISLAAAARMLGVWLAIVILPALFRYLTNLVESLGRGMKPAPPGSEFFRWIGETWSLFPAVIVVGLAWASYELYSAAGTGSMIVLIVVAGLLYPAMLGVLSVTHSPLQSMNPVAVAHFIRRIGPNYLIMPGYLALIVYLSTVARSLPYLAEVLFEMFLIFSLHSVIGSVMSPYGIFDDVSIPDATEQSMADVQRDIEKERTNVLTHAYGFISRGNREGGFKHITSEIAQDPDVVGAWAWFFDRMLRWEQKEHALFFAQQYIHDLLLHGENIPALKVIMRCRLINEQFKPLPGDMTAALSAAESSGNRELAAVLRRR